MRNVMQVPFIVLATCQTATSLFRQKPNPKVKTTTPSEPLSFPFICQTARCRSPDCLSCTEYTNNLKSRTRPTSHAINPSKFWAEWSLTAGCVLHTLLCFSASGHVTLINTMVVVKTGFFNYESEMEKETKWMRLLRMFFLRHSFILVL